MTAQRIGNVISLFLGGLKYVDIARALGCSHNAVAGIVHRRRQYQNLPYRGPNQHRDPSGFDQRVGWQRVQIAVPGRCKWIVGDPLGDWQYCGAACPVTSSWCAEHYRRVYGARIPARL
jgi:hypothetical protein